MSSPVFWQPSYTPKQDVSNALQHARALLQEGWCQSSFVVRLGEGRYEYCIVGALLEVTVHCTGGIGAVICYMTCLTVLCDALTLSKLPTCYLELQEFNDAPGRIQEEVLALFDRALTEITK